MMRWLHLLLVLGIISLTRWASAQAPCPCNCATPPLSEARLSQMSLTPQQCAEATCILRSAQAGSLVPVYNEDLDVRMELEPVAWVPMGQVLQDDQTCLRDVLSCRNPNPVLVQRLTREIARYRAAQAEIDNTIVAALSCVLSPEQIAQLTSPGCSQ